MPRTSRQRRGQQTAVLVAEYLQPIAPGCSATPSAYAGNDIKDIGWDVEVKAPREDGWSHAGKPALRPAAAGHTATPGPDPGCCVICGGGIRRQRFSLRGALKQACARRKPEHILPPMVVLRPDGTGDASVGEFIVLRRFEDDRAILDELFALRRKVTDLWCNECGHCCACCPEV